uniref:Uncharacterized protein n=1 Tax=Aegilops tauschii subsp. strangulata TaxID=200361 RepID=A0A453II02_AEGTS
CVIFFSFVGLRAGHFYPALSLAWQWPRGRVLLLLITVCAEASDALASGSRSRSCSPSLPLKSEAERTQAHSGGSSDLQSPGLVFYDGSLCASLSFKSFSIFAVLCMQTCRA